MLTADSVFNQLLRITECDESEKNALFPFCETAAAVINSKTRSDADASDIRLVMAAAAMAYSRYLLLKNADEGNISSVKAGDITISKGSEDASVSAASFASSAIEDAKDLLVDTAFVFSVM